MPFQLRNWERRELEALPIDKWTLRAGPGATYLPPDLPANHQFEALIRRLLRIVRLVARELADLGGWPTSVASGEAWHFAVGSYGADSSVRLSSHQDLELLTAIVAIGDGLEIATSTAPAGAASRAWMPAPACDGATLTLLSGKLAESWSRGFIPACCHRVSGGPPRRSFLLFYVGDVRLCRLHRQRRCECDNLAATLRDYHAQWWAERADHFPERGAGGPPKRS